MEDRVRQLEDQVRKLEYHLYKFIQRDKFYFDKGITFNYDLTLSEGIDINTGTATGSRIGGSASSLVSVYDATPVVRAASISAPSGGGSASTDAIDISARSKINSIRTALANFGITN